jgi:transcription termination factor Rho
MARPPRPGEKYAALLDVVEVNHEAPDTLAKLVPFDRLTVTHPDHRFLLETTPEEVAMRIVDLFCPLGRGQRALIVSPPRAGARERRSSSRRSRTASRATAPRRRSSSSSWTSVPRK